jgi:hypothetical protein
MHDISQKASEKAYKLTASGGEEALIAIHGHNEIPRIYT